MRPKIMSSNKILYLLFITCNVCYELWPFYQSEAASVPPANTTASQGKGGISSGTIVAIVAPISVAVLLLIVGYCCFNKIKRKEYGSDPERIFTTNMSNVDSLRYDFCTIQAATNNFSADNKLGKGGFGYVYRGVLLNGQEIAVKRLSISSGQGTREFKNEVEVLAKLQHTNVVKLLGFSTQGIDIILVYEYMPNKSLDCILFDPEKQRQLDWIIRYKIVKGIVRGIQYFHNDSRLRIIHRDLKASNILLDDDMNPKLADFGLAKTFIFDQIQRQTSGIMGTYGYLSPEYIRDGDISVKSDVYSFGVLLMEIIRGKRIYDDQNYSEPLLIYAWRLWKDGEALELLDPTIRECCDPNEVMKCIHISLLCVQDDPADRPSMSSILIMLENYCLTLPTPSPPELLDDPKNGFRFGQSRTKLTSMSVNDLPISEVISP